MWVLSISVKVPIPWSGFSFFTCNCPKNSFLFQKIIYVSCKIESLPLIWLKIKNKNGVYIPLKVWILFGLYRKPMLHSGHVCSRKLNLVSLFLLPLESLTIVLIFSWKAKANKQKPCNNLFCFFLVYFERQMLTWCKT